MAGIGFELRRMIDDQGGFLSKARAYLAAGLISSGPWLMTIMTLTLLNLLAPFVGVNAGIEMFRALVTYAFAFSLVLVGTGQMAITRRVADLLYGHQYSRVLPAFTASMLVTGVIAFLISATFCAVARFSPALSLVAVSLFMIVSMTWLALTWLSVAREYDMVLRAYVYGTLISIAGIIFCTLTSDTVGILAAYTAGQAFTLMLLTRTIVRGMEADGRREFSVLRALRSFPRLVGVGLFYNLAIWVDKMIFWFRDGIGPHEFVQFHPLYDTSCFLAYLTVVPALAVNLIRLETSFYEKYRAYYGAILAGTPLAYIEDKRERMFETLQESTIRLLRVQGAITVVIIIFAPYIINWLELDKLAIRVFRLACLGAFFHVMLLITILMQMYFDLRKQAMGTSLLFLLLNAGLAWWSVNEGQATYGVGYAAAAFISLLLGYALLHRSLEKLDYLTFTGQPIDDGNTPLDNWQELEAERKRSADAAAGMEDAEEEDEENDEQRIEEQPDVPVSPEPPVEDKPLAAETDTGTSAEPPPPAPRKSRVRDPRIYPVSLAEARRIAAKQSARTAAPMVDLLPDPFQIVTFDDSVELLDLDIDLDLDLDVDLDVDLDIDLDLDPLPQDVLTPTAREHTDTNQPSSSPLPEHATPPDTDGTATDLQAAPGGCSPGVADPGASGADASGASDHLSDCSTPPPPPEHATPPRRSGAAPEPTQPSPTATELGSMQDRIHIEPDRVILYPSDKREDDEVDTWTAPDPVLDDTDTHASGPIEVGPGNELTGPDPHTETEVEPE